MKRKSAGHIVLNNIIKNVRYTWGGSDFLVLETTSEGKIEPEMRADNIIMSGCMWYMGFLEY